MARASDFLSLVENGKKPRRPLGEAAMMPLEIGLDAPQVGWLMADADHFLSGAGHWWQLFASSANDSAEAAAQWLDKKEPGLFASLKRLPGVKFLSDVIDRAAEEFYRRGAVSIDVDPRGTVMLVKGNPNPDQRKVLEEWAAAYDFEIVYE